MDCHSSSKFISRAVRFFILYDASANEIHTEQAFIILPPAALAGEDGIHRAGALPPSHSKLHGDAGEVLAATLPQEEGGSIHGGSGRKSAWHTITVLDCH